MVRSALKSSLLYRFKRHEQVAKHEGEKGFGGSIEVWLDDKAAIGFSQNFIEGRMA